ncbi:MAG: hypothetical protein K2M31_02260 [Muribaculaceae bacterium]|nr:hypothetical protein [Muribaculaceae bacterium]
MADNSERNIDSKNSNGLSRIKNLFQTTPSGSAADTSNTPGIKNSNTKDSNETYRAWGVRWSGNAGANHTALNPALQSCYTQNVNEQKNNQKNQAKIQQNIQSQIEAKKVQCDGCKNKLYDHERKRDRLHEEIKGFQDKIDGIRTSDGKNIMAKVNFTIGAIITCLLAVYLFVFYSSASFSAFFGNSNITDAGQAILDSHCYAEAMQNGLGQLLFILLMPVIFLGLGFLIHQFGESGKGWGKYAKIVALYVVTFIFDALLAFEISEKVYNYTVLNTDPYTVSMAVNSPNFWIVIFSGFVAYVIWGMVFDFTLQHFDNMNAHTKEIGILEDKIKKAKHDIDNIESEINKIKSDINKCETEIAGLTTQLQGATLIDNNELRHALSDFFGGWVAYMNLAARPQSEKDEAHQTYQSFLSQINL